MSKAKLCLVHLMLFPVFFALHYFGLLQKVWESDETGVSLGMVGVFLIGVTYAFRGLWGRVEQFSEYLLQIGLVGTVLGFIVAFSGVDPQQAMDVNSVSALVASLISGMGTALMTTLVGALGWLWLTFVRNYFNAK